MGSEMCIRDSGILHLLGYDHYEEPEEVEMKKMEKILIGRHIKHLRVDDV